MKIDLENLPSEANILQQIIATLAIENDALLSEKESLATKNNSLLSEVELLKEQLRLLKAKRFGKSSEKLDSQIQQLELWIEENELALAKLEQIVETDLAKLAEKRSPKRLKLPAHTCQEKILS